MDARSSKHPPFDEELMDLASRLPAAPASLTPEEIHARRAASAVILPPLDRDGAILIEERVVPGTHGQPQVPVTILRSREGTRGPGIIYAHGGGMVTGSSRHIDPTMLDAVDEGGAVLISVDYRLAPEHQFPAQLDDCYAVLQWVHDHALEIAVDPGRLLIAGSSAGAGLAAGIALMARDRGGPHLSHQILFCPMLDDRAETPSSQELDGVGRWDRNANRTGWAAYLGIPDGSEVSPYAAPARATDLSRLPPAFIDVGTVETFRDEDINYAARLSQAGVPVEFHMWPGGFHGFNTAVPSAAISIACNWTRRQYLRRVLSPERAILH